MHARNSTYAPEIVTDEPISTPHAERVLFVASTGGHLTELHRLSRRMPASPDSVWLTFDTPQSRSLLSGQRVEFVPYVSPRDIPGTIRTFLTVLRLFRREKFDHVISTGAAVAVGAFLAAVLTGVRRTYIESIARVERPSLTGRIVATLRLAKLRTQTTAFGSTRWTPHPSVLSHFNPYERSYPENGRKLRVFVTLGTIRPYRFDELLASVRKCADQHDLDITWQVGHTTGVNLPGTVHTVVDTATFRQLALDADVVVTHTGVGTLLDLFDLGVFPVVAPRRRQRNEHVDDHQTELARIIERQHLGIVVDAQELAVDTLIEAARHGVRGVAA